MSPMPAMIAMAMATIASGAAKAPLPKNWLTPADGVHSQRSLGACRDKTSD